MTAVLVDSALQSISCRKSDLSAVVVGKGPGSYTGLRTGVAFAKGLCLGLGIPLIAVGALENLQYQMRKRHPDFEVYLPLLDARRDEVYLGMFDPDGQTLLSARALVLPDPQILQMAENRKVLLGGNGATKGMALFSNPSAWQSAPDVEPTADISCVLAMEKWISRDFEPLDSFEPDYLKPVFIKSGN